MDRGNLERPIAALTLQLLAWVDERPRTYAETIDAWRTSCPRLSVWEDAQAAGLVRVDSTPGSPPMVALTERGRELLRSAG